MTVTVTALVAAVPRRHQAAIHVDVVCVPGHGQHDRDRGVFARLPECVAAGAVAGVWREREAATVIGISGMIEGDSVSACGGRVGGQGGGGVYGGVEGGFLDDLWVGGRGDGGEFGHEGACAASGSGEG